MVNVFALLYIFPTDARARKGYKHIDHIGTRWVKFNVFYNLSGADVGADVPFHIVTIGTRG